MRIDGNQVRMARAALKMDVRELATKAGFDKMTVVRVEAGESVRGSTYDRLQIALEEAGVYFIPANEPIHGPGVALKHGFMAFKTSDNTDENDVANASSSTLKAWDWNDGEGDDLREYFQARPHIIEKLSEAGKTVLGL